MERVRVRIEEDARPAVNTVRAKHGALPLEIILGLGAAAEDDGRLSHHEQHLADGEVDDHDHDEFESFVASGGIIVDQAVFTSRIQDVMREHDILRLKGFAAVDGKDMRLVVQAVGPRVDSYFDREWRNGETRETRLVVIGEAGLDHEAVSRSLAVLC